MARNDNKKQPTTDEGGLNESSSTDESRNPALQDITNQPQVGRTDDPDLSVGMTLAEQNEAGVAEQMRKNADPVEAGSEDPDDSFLRPEGDKPGEDSDKNRGKESTAPVSDSVPNSTNNQDSAEGRKSSDEERQAKDKK